MALGGDEYRTVPLRINYLGRVSLPIEMGKCVKVINAKVPKILNLVGFCFEVFFFFCVYYCHHLRNFVKLYFFFIGGDDGCKYKAFQLITS